MADFIILKEGELKLLALLSGKYVHGVISKININEDFSLFKEEMLLDIENDCAWLRKIPNFKEFYSTTNILPVYASRGCVANCTFCAHKIFWDGYRAKTPVRMMRELNFYYRKWGRDSFYFMDMLINGSSKWLDVFSELLVKNPHKFIWSSYARVQTGMDSEKAEKLAGAGCSFISLGIESNSQNVLDTVKKGVSVEDNLKNIQQLSNAGIFIHASFIIGLPYENTSDFLETTRFIKENIWDMDHVEVFFFENFKQSPGYEFSKDYLENYSQADKYSLKRELYNKYIVDFNRIGSSFLDVNDLFSPESHKYKKYIKRYYRAKYLNDICFYEDVPDRIKTLAQNMHSFKLEQIKLLEKFETELLSN